MVHAAVHAAVEATMDATMMDAPMMEAAPETFVPEAAVVMEMMESIREEDRASDE
jgi:hypothetical protein